MVLQANNHSKVNEKKKHKRYESRNGLVGRKVREIVN